MPGGARPQGRCCAVGLLPLGLRPDAALLLKAWGWVLGNRKNGDCDGCLGLRTAAHPCAAMRSAGVVEAREVALRLQSQVCVPAAREGRSSTGTG